MQKELRDAFRLYDKEGKRTIKNYSTCKCIGICASFIAGNGYITTQTLKDILAQIDDKLTSDDLDGMIEEIDIDGTGRIDVEGFYYIYFLGIVQIMLIYLIHGRFREHDVQLACHHARHLESTSRYNIFKRKTFVLPFQIGIFFIVE